MLYDYPQDIKFLPVAFPFIDLHAATTCDEPDITYLMLYSASFAWLRNANGLGGHVGPNDADENLLRFADLAGCLVNNGTVRVRNADLSLHGSLFRAEQERIMDVLSAVVPLTTTE